MKLFGKKDRQAAQNEAEPMIEQRQETNSETTEKEKTMEKKDRIFNLIILDESGSMSSVYRAALDGANETINSIKGAQANYPEQNHYLTFVTFDQGIKAENVRFIIDTKKIAEVNNLTESDYQPYGGTPLYDAVGISLTRLEKQVTEEDNVLVTIITDGYENASRKYSGHQVKEMIDRLKARGWTFVFMGANIDSGEVAKALSIDNAMDFRADEDGFRDMSRKVNDNRRMYYEKVRAAKKRGRRFFNDEDFFNEKRIARNITPENITTLDPDSVLVFGSNILGHHDGGIAKLAAERFGAVYGQASGPQGQSYAIVTGGVPLDTIRQQVEEFLAYASQHPEKTFLVTKIGCGGAGFSPENIAPLFAYAYQLNNVCLPEEFWEVLGGYTVL